MRYFIAPLLLASATVLSGCNTVRGVGQDVESVAAAFDPHATYAACGTYGPIDHDGDGRISLAEWNSYRDAGFAAWDVNHDGRISRREFASCWYGGGFYPKYNQANWEPAFNALDANGDGSISRGEFWSASAWARLDRNSDGFIDGTEWTW
jgi:predicted small secreted protein